MLKNLIKFLELKSLFVPLMRTVEKVYPNSRHIVKNREGDATITHGFDKIDVVYPEYDIYYKMSKQEREHHLPQHHCKKGERDFFSEPRFLVRI
jgi:hypothetical protein